MHQYSHVRMFTVIILGNNKNQDIIKVLITEELGSQCLCSCTVKYYVDSERMKQSSLKIE